ncbi:MAG: hypothetical protein V3S01_02090 [Dehalococcoidia bacterium]
MNYILKREANDTPVEMMRKLGTNMHTLAAFQETVDHLEQNINTPAEEARLIRYRDERMPPLWKAVRILMTRIQLDEARRGIQADVQARSSGGMI